jgi:hypothetical protein
MIRLLALHGALFDDICRNVPRSRVSGNLPLQKATHKQITIDSLLTQLLPDHSQSVVTTTFVELAPAHVKQVLVLTLNALPLGTSGVLVVVIIEMYLSGSK